MNFKPHSPFLHATAAPLEAAQAGIWGHCCSMNGVRSRAEGSGVTSRMDPWCCFGSGCLLLYGSNQPEAKKKNIILSPPCLTVLKPPSHLP